MWLFLGPISQDVPHYGEYDSQCVRVDRAVQLLRLRCCRRRHLRLPTATLHSASAKYILYCFVYLTHFVLCAFLVGPFKQRMRASADTVWPQNLRCCLGSFDMNFMCCLLNLRMWSWVLTIQIWCIAMNRIAIIKWIYDCLYSTYQGK